VGDPGEEISDKKYRVVFVIEEKAFHFQLKRGLSIDEHMNNYTKFLTDLINVDVKIKEEDKVLILLNSLPDEEYEIFTFKYLATMMYRMLL